MQTRRILLQNRLIQLQNRRIQLQNRPIQLQTGRIQLQYRRIQLQTGRIQLQRRRIQLQKPVIIIINYTAVYTHNLPLEPCTYIINYVILFIYFIHLFID